MTVSAIYEPPQFVGDGVTAGYGFPYQYFEATDLSVTLLNSATNSFISPPPTLNGEGTYDFTVTGMADPSGTGEFLYATITFNTAPPSNLTITIERNVSITQETVFNTYGPLPAKAIEAGLDRLTIVAQQNNEALGRAIIVPPGDPENISRVLPPAPARINQFVMFDGEGNVTTGLPTGAGVAVSTAMIPVLAAATLALAVAALGLASTTVAGLGAALLGYFQPVTGWVGRTISARLFDRVSVKDFRATGNGVTDDTAAFQAAAASGTASIWMPSGRYVLSSSIALSPGQQWQGAGNAATTLIVAFSGAALEMLNTSEGEGNITIRDLTINGAAANTTGIAITLADTVLIENVIFQGLTTNIIDDRSRWATVRDCLARGNATYQAGQTKFWSSVDTNYHFFLTLDNYRVNTGLFDSGVVQGSVSPAIYLRRCVQFSIINPQIDHGEVGTPCNFILIENDSQGGQIMGGASHGCTIGILTQQGAGAAVSPSYLEIIGHDVDKFSTAGIRIDGNASAASALIKIIGGCMTAPASGAPCLDIIDCLGVSAMGVICQDYTLAHLGTGLNLTGVVTMTMTACQFSYLNIGIDFESSTISNTYIANNTATNCTTGLTGTISGEANRVVGNRGINPLAVTTPAAAYGSPFINTTGTDVTVYVTSGTVTSAIVNGTTISSATQGPFQLAATAVIELAGTGTLAWTWAGS